MKKLCTILFVLAAFLSAHANNIQVSNITVSGADISFNIQWDNSWNTAGNINPLYPNNHDGAWVFIKYQNAIDNLWKHAVLSTNAADHTIAGGVLEINTVPDGMGVFIRRSSAGFGNIASTSVTLKMNTLTGTGTFNYKVFGAEMVYVPAGAYEIGDRTGGGAIYTSKQSIGTTQQTTGIAAGALYTGSPAIPASFPMGVNAFYSMKYEISCEQWVDFLNTLNYDQQVSRIAFNTPQSPVGTAVYTSVPSGVSYIRTIRVQSPGANNTLPATFGCDFDNDNIFNETSDGQNIVMTGINRSDLAAYLDWSGLRPMTEMEYEKACRGSRPAVLNEFAWGSVNLTFQKRSGTTNQGLPTEIISNSNTTNGNSFLTYAPFNSDGPGRVGIFGTASSGRESSGASFYGIMELTGNAAELAINTASSSAFDGQHGNGQLTIQGGHDVSNWPATGAGNFYLLKGNCFASLPGTSGTAAAQSSYAYVSYRYESLAEDRAVCYGGRGVRTAP